MFYVALGALTGPEGRVNHPLLCTGAVGTERRRSLGGCAGGVGAERNLLPEGKLLHFLYL